MTQTNPTAYASLADMLGYTGAAESPTPTKQAQDGDVITTTVRLRKDQVMALKREALDTESSMSAILRQIVDAHLAKTSKR